MSPTTLTCFTPELLASIPLPSNGVIVTGTPLGNLYDLTPRQAAVMARAGVIAAEDTRRLKNLAAASGVTISGEVVSNFDHNEQARVEHLIEKARHTTVAIMTDAGMPVVSDPGYVLIAAAHQHNIPVTVVPGPSAVTTALAGSGIASGQWMFAGFVPRKPGAKKAFFAAHAGLIVDEKNPEQAADELETSAITPVATVMICFESPHRIADTLAVAAEVCGDDTPACVCRELTKTYEEYRSGTLAELAAWAADGVKGEITLVIGQPTRTAVADDIDSLVAAAEKLVADGMKLKNACQAVTKGTSVTKNELYDTVVRRRG